ncbi:enoyl-CoA hydratase/isomerase family protein [Halostagnicola sp. A-GB9-2]|uniref:enoyl-CoA hydratase/isomerase family protein n=1 Tax=Halostagnicola sp. A-GB9-2 TaxID=3048066 RepID=UPI0024BFDC7B|nr:enoyl-CoA hydratase/isomerase family protein [Halostagnicola sp. A-GB9-2]MDJ1434819.1 enoyl-CoA hydratase/isomerase family protein [Halostagnicola sp. A-GB9-2]
MHVELEHLSVEKEGKIARITLDRPERLNAIHHPLTRDLNAVSQLLENDRNVRLITIRGAGRAFCSGIDLKELAKGEIDDRMFPLWEEALRRFETMDKLVICLIDGYAIGGGLQIALASDIRVCTRSAELGLTAIEESILPGLGTWRLPRYVGMGRAKKMNILGNYVDGEEAKRIGLVDHLVDEGEKQQEFEEIIEDYMVVNSAGARLTKQATVESFDRNFEGFLDRYLELQAEAMDDDDFEEAMAAIREDREPEWT